MSSHSLCWDGHVNIIQDMMPVCPLILCVGIVTLTSHKVCCQRFLSHSLCRDDHVNIIQDMSVCPLCVGMVMLTSYKKWCQAFPLYPNGLKWQRFLSVPYLEIIQLTTRWQSLSSCVIYDYKVTEFVFLCHIRHQSYKMPVLAYLHLFNITKESIEVFVSL